MQKQISRLEAQNRALKQVLENVREDKAALEREVGLLEGRLDSVSKQLEEAQEQVADKVAEQVAKLQQQVADSAK